MIWIRGWKSSSVDTLSPQKSKSRKLNTLTFASRPNICIMKLCDVIIKKPLLKPSLKSSTREEVMTLRKLVRMMDDADCCFAILFVQNMPQKNKIIHRR